MISVAMILNVMELKSSSSLFLKLCILIHLCQKGFSSVIQMKQVSDITQENTVVDLIKRLIPEKAHLFSIIVDNRLYEGDLDSFLINSGPDIVNISGSSGVAAAWGFHHFLKYYCHAHVSWEGNQVEIQDPFPTVENLRIIANEKWRYYQNVVTYSYSFLWWDWPKWENHLDWMALNGINLALAFTGQEEIFRRTFSEYNLTNVEISEYFTGPAFLAWGRMGNIQSWGGPLSVSWYSKRVKLQHKILDRMRNFGMFPVLPAFSGHVPFSLINKFPGVKYSRFKSWAHFKLPFCCTYMIDPTDPFFKKFGISFMEKLVAEFGRSLIYSGDLFNEIEPASSSPEYLDAAGKALFSVLTAVDSNAIWLMQGWQFLDTNYWHDEQIKALLNSVPQGSMIVLDLFAEMKPFYIRTQSFFGQPFIWCMLQNFGGTLGMYGTLDFINKGVYLARSFPNNSMVGTGITMEGINQNYIMYDFMLETAWRKQSVDIKTWINQYAIRRYGKLVPNMQQSWNYLSNTVYNCTEMLAFHGRHMITRRPNLDLKPLIWYDARFVIKSWDLMLRVNTSELSINHLFCHDLVDLTRQVMQLIFPAIFNKVVKQYNLKNYVLFKAYSGVLLDILADLDKILSTDEHFMLGSWLNDAVSWGDNEKEKSSLLENAKNQITLWGPSGEILDYGTKQWSGIVADYYLPRWKLFIDELGLSILRNTTFNKNEFYKKVFLTVEKPFTLSNKTYSHVPEGDTILIIKNMYTKWRGAFTVQVLNYLHRSQLKWLSVARKSNDEEYVKSLNSFTMLQTNSSSTDEKSNDILGSLDFRY